MPLEERPREKLEKRDPGALATSELLSILLASGTKEKSVTELSLELLTKVGKLADFETITLEELCQVKGIGPAKATTVLAAIELGKRIFLAEEEKKISLASAADVFKYSKYLFRGKKQEYFYCIYVDSKRFLIRTKLLFVGTMTKSSVHPRDIFREAYKVSASGIICLHNHPSGVTIPSGKDIEFTKDLIEIGTMQGIPILDHLIVSEHNYFSFGENSIRRS